MNTPPPRDHHGDREKQRPGEGPATDGDGDRDVDIFGRKGGRAAVDAFQGINVT